MSGAALFHTEMRAAVRSLLLTLMKCSSGAIAASVSGATYTRENGSFVDDHFTPGDEVEIAGFGADAGDGLAIVRAVDDLTLTLEQPLTSAAPSGMITPVTFTCGLPSGMAWEDVTFSPTDGRPFVSEAFRPISSVARGLGKGGMQAHTSSANFVVNYPTEFGAFGAELMAGTMLDLFEPGTQLVYGSSSGTVMAAERKPLLPAADYIGVPVLVTIVGHTARI
jgi:hypothetical protein